MANASLHRARKAKNDEFYTQMPDIIAEMDHYNGNVPTGSENRFAGRTVYCNCDDPTSSNFFKYFASNFDSLKLKRLVATHYDREHPTYMLEMVAAGGSFGDPAGFGVGLPGTYRPVGERGLDDVNAGSWLRSAWADGSVHGHEVWRTDLGGNGDFRSHENIELLKRCDIVVTNPPFSEFRDYVAQLVEYDKKFIIIGNMNAITYKEIFPLIRDGRLWLGATGGSMTFVVPDDAPKVSYVEDGVSYCRFGNILWYTNVDFSKRHEPLETGMTYRGNESMYPKYDNYDAINVDKTKYVPDDYRGVIGVPISFLTRFNPDQFDIVAFRKGNDGRDLVWTREKERVQPYFRILVRRRRG